MSTKRSSRSSTSTPPSTKKNKINSNINADLDSSQIVVIVEDPKSPKDDIPIESDNDASSSSDTDNTADDEGSSSGSDFEFESLAKTRSRRAVAGNRMNQLIAEAKSKMRNTMTEEDAEVYKDFVDVEDDKDFEAEDRLKSDSEVDSDFDEDEHHEESEDVGEVELKNERKAERVARSEQQKKKREKLMKELATNLLVDDNVVDDKTHEKYLKEAKEVAIKNKADLLRIEEQIARRREEDLAAFKPIIRQQRTDVFKLRKAIETDGSFVKQFVIPDDYIPQHEPDEIWLSKQHLMPPKPEGFDDIPPEKVGFGF